MFPLLAAIPSMVFGTVNAVQSGKATKEANQAAGRVAGQDLFDAHYQAAKAAQQAEDENARSKRFTPYAIAAAVGLAIIIIIMVKRRT